MNCAGATQNMQEKIILVTLFTTQAVRKRAAPWLNFKKFKSLIRWHIDEQLLFWNKEDGIDFTSPLQHGRCNCTCMQINLPESLASYQKHWESLGMSFRRKSLIMASHWSFLTWSFSFFCRIYQFYWKFYFKYFKMFLCT